MVSREISSWVNWILDNIVPPVIRDKKWFMAPITWLAFGSKYKLIMHFKEKLPYLAESEIEDVYKQLDENSGITARTTDLNKKSISFILENLAGTSVVDVGCGKGYLLERIRLVNNQLLLHGFDYAPPQSTYIQYKSGNLIELPYEDNGFDTVICTHTLEHVRNMDMAIDELLRITNKRLIVVLPKQRPYKYTVDLHVNFFPYLHDLQKVFPMPSAKFLLIGNDWLCMVDV